MCGIACVVFDEARRRDDVDALLSSMCDAQSARGPDGKYVWTDGRVGLAMVRLAIVGSEFRGRQPIMGEAGNRLIFNGELYEPDRAMAATGASFDRHDCDGAALLRLLERRGLEGLRDFSAMFALAFHQPESGSLLLARDARGKKPLYRCRLPDGWAFASTIAALHAAAGPFQVRTEAMHECLIFKSVGGHGSAFIGVDQIPAGCWMRISADGATSEGRWFVPQPPDQALSGDPERARELINAAVHMRLPERFRSSIFLSGGLDSSIVAALAAADETRPKPHVLTVGYDVGGWQDEHALAVRLADELGLQQQSLIIDADSVPALLRDSAIALEDPNHDPVVVPTLALARVAAKETKVVLTGDGADEFWGGYARFDNPPHSLEAYLERTMVFRPGELGLQHFPMSYLGGITLLPGDTPDPLDWILRLEASNRLRNYHLARIDKLTMSAGLEARAPFLDVRVTSYAESLPAREKRLGARPKGLLIDAFKTLLPPWLLQRKKQPFTVPIESWLSGPLKAFAHDTLGPSAFVRQFADPTPLLSGLAEPASAAPCAQRIWSLLHLEIWYREFARKMAQNP
jgi:asparagine synthase (glutamine-hydrolysing)